MVNILSQRIIGRIVNYRTGPRTQMSRECLIQFENVDSVSTAGQLIGRKVAWKKGNNKFVGRIASLHGKNGMVRVRFKKGVPGQAIGNTVELVN